ncbi:hypothetical protein A2U01_0025319 [Trifolium medium]|uniref:Uncharacterized protein n=1 Tax=Trifolium medium TaxID=97028 RepID=A0A392NWT9_9FABA|nr:hypothetical protein [Trifolium medium]
MISDGLRLNGETHVWSWWWCEALSVSDEHQLIALKELLVGFSLHLDMSDMWRWVPGLIGLFSIKSCYNLLLRSCNFVTLDLNVLVAVQWKNDVPSEVNVFGCMEITFREVTYEGSS